MHVCAIGIMPSDLEQEQGEVEKVRSYDMVESWVPSSIFVPSKCGDKAQFPLTGTVLPTSWDSLVEHLGPDTWQVWSAMVRAFGCGLVHGVRGR